MAGLTYETTERATAANRGASTCRYSICVRDAYAFKSSSDASPTTLGKLARIAHCLISPHSYTLSLRLSLDEGANLVLASLDALK